MKNLSELSNDFELLVETSNDYIFMTKEEFLESEYYISNDKKWLWSAEKQTILFDLQDIIESIGENDAYEDWASDVYDDLKDLPETQSFLNKVKEIFNRHPVYYPGFKICIDI